MAHACNLFLLVFLISFCIFCAKVCSLWFSCVFGLLTVCFSVRLLVPIGAYSPMQKAQALQGPDALLGTYKAATKLIGA